MILCVDCRKMLPRSLGDERRCKACDEKRGERLWSEDQQSLCVHTMVPDPGSLTDYCTQCGHRE